MNYKFFLKYYLSKYFLLSLYMMLLHFIPPFYIFGSLTFALIPAQKVVFPLFWNSLLGKLFILHNYISNTPLAKILFKIPSLSYIILAQIPASFRNYLYLLINIILSILFIFKTGAVVYTIPWLINSMLLVYQIIYKQNNIIHIWTLIWIYSQIGTVVYGYLNGFLSPTHYTMILFPIIIEKTIWTLLYFINSIILSYIDKISLGIVNNESHRLFFIKKG